MNVRKIGDIVWTVDNNSVCECTVVGVYQGPVAGICELRLLVLSDSSHAGKYKGNKNIVCDFTNVFDTKESLLQSIRCDVDLLKYNIHTTDDLFNFVLEDAYGRDTEDTDNYKSYVRKLVALEKASEVGLNVNISRFINNEF